MAVGTDSPASETTTYSDAVTPKVTRLRDEGNPR
jgi:hypothetical protein